MSGSFPDLFDAITELVVLSMIAGLGSGLFNLYLIHDRPRSWLLIFAGIGVYALGALSYALRGVANYQSVTLSIAEDVLYIVGSGLAVVGIHALARELTQYVTRDSLTGAYTRHYFNTRLKAEVANSQRNGSSFSVLFVDVNDFKAVNDIGGHDFGDQVLMHLAMHMLREMRLTDVVARWGGDEFVILVPGLTSSDVMQVVERVQQAAQLAGQEMGVPVDISVGHATYPADSTDVAALMRLADKGMYGRKSQTKHLRFNQEPDRLHRPK